MNKTDLQTILSSVTPQKDTPVSKYKNTRKLERNSNVPKHPEGVSSPKTPTSDSLDLKNRRYDSNLRKSYKKKPAARLDENAIKKMAKKLPKKEADLSANVIKILNKNAPHAMKSLRAIVASRTGMDQFKGVNLEQLERTLSAAEGTPDPSRRAVDVMHGVGLVPQGQKEKFLKAAESMLLAESRALQNARPQPRPGGNPQINVNEPTGVYAPQDVGFEMKVDFDLFFSVSSRYAMKSGENSSGSYYEAAHQVSSSFESNFSIEISGRFLELADMAESLDPAVLDAFSGAVQGLAGMDDDALNRFFEASTELFGEIEASMGLAEGTLDGTVQKMKATAESFFHSVSSAVDGVFPGLEVDQIFSLPENLDSNGNSDLLSMMNKIVGQSLMDMSSKPDGSLSNLLASLTAAENARGLENAGHTSGLNDLLEDAEKSLIAGL